VVRIIKFFRGKFAVPPRLKPHRKLIFGKAAPERFEILENGVRYEMSFKEGLFRRPVSRSNATNRRRFLTGHIAANFFVHVGGDEFHESPFNSAR